MHHISPSSLAHLSSRVSYLQSFLTFDSTTDGPSLTSSAEVLRPVLSQLLDAVYTNLLSFDITAKSFAPKQQTHEADIKYAGGNTKVEELSLDHENIKFRRDFLKGYLLKILSTKDWSPQSPIWDYLDKVGIMHTGNPSAPGFAHRGKKPSLRVEYMHMGLLLGFVEQAVAGVVLSTEAEGWDTKKKGNVLVAWNKLVWIQNDLFARHYTVDWDVGVVPKANPAMEAINTLRATNQRRTELLGILVLGIAIGSLFIRLLGH
ncbi:MAG: hypothetical protein Q9160_006408 [Pyrenula sp. 1 TL-2023]